MTNSVDESPPLRERFAEVFSRLPEQDIEQFYAHYQLWLLRRRVPILQKQIEALDEHLAENQQVLQSLQPSAVALAVLARLQANGVSNTELLDQLLARGEDWLDRMMQRLDYCEQVQDFIQGDYTQWCSRSLEGAYDWIDTLLGSVNGGEQPRPPVEADAEATEELLLRKLRQDDEEDLEDPTLRQPTVNSTGEDGEPDTSAQRESGAAPLLVDSSDEHAGGERVASEQPPELVDWDDLDAPGERPAPWYGVCLAADGSGGSGQPDEMNEWIKVLQEEGTSQVTTDALQETVESMGATEAAEMDTAGAEHEGGEMQAVDGVLGASEPALPTEMPGEPDAGAEERTGEEAQEDAGPVVEQHEAWEEDRGVQGAPGDGDGPDLVEEVPGARAVIEVLPGDGAGVPDDTSQQEPDVEPAVETARQPQEQDTAEIQVGETPEALEQGPEVQASGGLDLADPQKEQRPWYEYLSLNESGSAQGRASDERRVEPDPAALAAVHQEEAGDLEPEQDATRPMALRAMQREREQTDPGSGALATGDEARGAQLAETGVSVAAGQDADGAGASPDLAVPEATLRAVPAGGDIQPPLHPTGTRAPVLSPRVEPALSRPLAQGVPKKRSFWRRHFGWLWGAEEEA